MSNKNFSENYALGEIGTVVFDIKTTPKVNNVNVPANGTYTTGQNLDFTANFNENIIVNTTSGTPQIAVTIGSVVRQATYISGSGTSTLLFRYTVTTGDLDTDGIAVGALSANGSTLQDASGNNANLTLNSVGSTLNVLVDSTLSIDAFKNEAQFSMYPNPSRNNVNIKTSLGGEFQIINQLGQNVKTFRLQSAIENNIYVGNLSNGLYFVKGSNGVSKKLVIKN
ncbi:hypothetical protein GCM10022291_06450 [Postechiella marina]|uniref:Secretion system C-terminal sorting domain-containing protein n=1 Tax=Postechiella marina TaxID=943941 RepID=A0ABP8C2G6_9FLAO